MLRSVVAQRPEARAWWLAFEYELPQEGGRRPDAILVTARDVLVIEVKDTERATSEGIAQCAAYVRDFQEYHACCRALDVRGVLYVTRWPGRPLESNGVRVVSENGLAEAILSLRGGGPSMEDVGDWLRAPYAPLPSLIEAAKRIFRDEPLPQLKRVQNSNIPLALETLHGIAERASRDRAHHLVLLTGAPGAGKTLVGLKFVHDYSQPQGPRAVFLSGNGPLVTALQHILRKKVFVRDLHAFMREYGVKQQAASPEAVLIFDEAQRAWDQAKVQKEYPKKWNLQHDASEPETFLHIVGRRDAGGVLVGLVGYGQEIHSGEEGGMAQWRDAIERSPIPFVIHCPPRLRAHFEGLTIEEHTSLDLGVSIRAHAADNLPLWVESLLEGRLGEARRHADRLRASGFYLHVTQDLDNARAFLEARYAEEPTKTYGILASSKSENLANYGLDTSFYSRMTVPRFAIGKWIHGDEKNPPTCRAMTHHATEFQCQGLELDGVLVAWGSDLVWEDDRWVYHGPRSPGVKDLLRIRKNSYRVLLTRGRDGAILYCPPGKEMEDTARAIREAGCGDLW